MRDGRAEALRARLAERLPNDAALRKAYADLRETCAFAIDPRTAERDLARLLDRYLGSGGSDTPIGPRFEEVIARLSFEESVRKASVGHASLPPGAAAFIHDGVATLLREHLGLELRDVRVLDPWAGVGEITATIGARETYANEADPVRYACATRRVGRGTVFADSFRLPDRRPTPGFEFGGDENIARVGDEQSLPFPVVVGDLRIASRPDARALKRTKESWDEKADVAPIRWMADRLSDKGVVAFVSDLPFIDEPTFAGLRAGLEQEFCRVVHLTLPNGLGITFLVRAGGGVRVLYAEAATVPETFAAVGWRELHPTETHVWRTEILRPEWTSFPPLAAARGAIFAETDAGLAEGTDAVVPGPKARRVLRLPFAPAWRTPDRKARRGAPSIEGPKIVLLAEPFGVLAANAPIDRRMGGTGTSVLAVGGRVAAEALKRFRAMYGAAVTERDVFEATLALLHHPEYRVRFHEDLRRSVPRLPLPSVEALTVLEEESDAPPVGPGTAFRTGWLDDDLFEPGTVPDYDDPFASPYARADVAPGFLLLVGLGAALYRVQVDFERLIPHPLVSTGEPGPVERMRLSADRERLVLGTNWSLEAIPPEALEHRFGRRSAPEWVVEGFRARLGFDPNVADDPNRPARLFAQAVSASLETRRLAEIVGSIDLERIL